MHKYQLRQQYSTLRRELTASNQAILNDKILHQFQKLPLPFLQTVLSYYPLLLTHEPDTFLITRYLQFINVQLQIAYPTIINATTFTAVLQTNDTEFTQNKYGIAEIQDGITVQPSEIELVLVPLLAFDNYGNRIGYGNGYYDKYLHTCNTNVVKVGLSFFEPVAHIADVQHFDIPLTFGVTPTTIYEF